MGEDMTPMFYQRVALYIKNTKIKKKILKNILHNKRSCKNQEIKLLTQQTILQELGDQIADTTNDLARIKSSNC